VEVAGFGARAGATFQTDKIMPYIIQSLFILLPPIFFAATIYMCLGRVIRLLQADHLSPIKPAKLTKTFVGFDALSFLVQCNSSPLQTAGENSKVLPKVGQALVLVGLTIQLVAFSVFFWYVDKFAGRIKARPTQESSRVDQSWREVMKLLYVTSLLIIVRSIFRFIEYAMGQNGYLLSNE
jgi:hypothetical protein